MFSRQFSRLFARTSLKNAFIGENRFYRSNYKFFLGGAIGTTIVTTGLINNFHPITLDNGGVFLDKSVDPFPTKIGNYSMVGSGIRSVTFLGFKVYAVGIYINHKDIIKAKTVLKNYDLGDLNDEEKSGIIIADLLNNNVDFLIRISPVRNTDFGHLRDGFIKSILAHPISKTKRDDVNEGLQQLRSVFMGYKGSVPKNHLLMLLTSNGKLTISYSDNKTVSEMGKVDNELVGQLLLLQYMSGKKPLSEPLRQSCNEGWKQIAKE